MAIHSRSVVMATETIRGVPLSRLAAATVMAPLVPAAFMLVPAPIVVALMPTGLVPMILLVALMPAGFVPTILVPAAMPQSGPAPTSVEAAALEAAAVKATAVKATAVKAAASSSHGGG
jgi:hypothetical protein